MLNIGKMPLPTLDLASSIDVKGLTAQSTGFYIVCRSQKVYICSNVSDTVKEFSGKCSTGLDLSV